MMRSRNSTVRTWATEAEFVVRRGSATLLEYFRVGVRGCSISSRARGRQKLLDADPRCPVGARRAGRGLSVRSAPARYFLTQHTKSRAHNVYRVVDGARRCRDAGYDRSRRQARKPSSTRCFRVLRHVTARFGEPRWPRRGIAGYNGRKNRFAKRLGHGALFSGRL